MTSRAGFYIWLSELIGAGSPLFKKIYEAFDGDLVAVYNAESTEYISRGLDQDTAELLCDKDFSRANMTIDYCAENGVGLLLMGSEYYPQRLYDIENPPILLYYKGKIERLRERATITAVGSRQCSQAAHDSAYKLCYKLACDGVSVVSGLADGIDSACIKGTLDGGGLAIGVLGSGINILYPFDNTDLFSRMFRQGIVLTEFSPFTEPRAQNFPIRNRIMAALGDGVLVVEARKESGALITVDYALQYGKKVFVVPGAFSNPLCQGSNALLKQGAIPVTETADLLEHMQYAYPDSVSVKTKHRRGQLSQRLQRRKRKEKQPQNSDNTAVGAFEEVACEKSSEKSSPMPDTSVLSQTEKDIYLALRQQAMTADALGEGLSMSQNKILASLTMLEIYGFVKSLPGGIYEAL